MYASQPPAGQTLKQGVFQGILGRIQDLSDRTIDLQCQIDRVNNIKGSPVPKTNEGTNKADTEAPVPMIYTLLTVIEARIVEATETLSTL